MLLIELLFPSQFLIKLGLNQDGFYNKQANVNQLNLLSNLFLVGLQFPCQFPKTGSMFSFENQNLVFSINHFLVTDFSLENRNKQLKRNFSRYVLFINHSAEGGERVVLVLLQLIGWRTSRVCGKTVIYQFLYFFLFIAVNLSF